jgi:hypothetical protein
MRALGALLLLVLLAGCADRAAVGSGPGSSPSASLAADGLAIQVRSSGGMMPTTARVTALPVVSVYGDGRVITPAPVPAIYPGPALEGLQVEHLTPAQVSSLVDQGLRAGVGSLGDLGQPQVSDAPSTMFFVAGRTTEVDALGIGADGTLTKKQRDARKQLQSLLDMLTGLSTKGATPYVPARVAAVSTPWVAGTTGLPQPPPAVAWPGPQLPGDKTAAYGCVVAAGAQAAAVVAAAGKANSQTPWTSAGAQWRLALRPLLPDESTCADLNR